MILDRLRAETRDLHERVEHRLPLLDARLTLAGYRATLQALHGLHAPLERRLAAVPGLERCGLDLARRWRAPRLAADLRALGAPPSALDAASPHVPHVGDVASALGALYVLEGSTLGGRVVARHVTAALPVTAADGCAFLASAGTHVGRSWRSFRHAVEAYAAARDDAVAQAIVDGARATFVAFDRATAGLRPAPR